MLDKFQAMAADTSQIPRNPRPVQAYKISLTPDKAPGPFTSILGVAQYDLVNEECLPPPDSNFAGHGYGLSVDEPFLLTQVADNQYEGIIHTDLMRDQDYFGRGICQWELVDVRALLRATGSGGETTFIVHTTRHNPTSQEPITTYFRKELYPLVADLPNYSNTGQTDRGQFTRDIADADLFTITMTAKKVQP